MATIKSYTDIEQSRKLAEILPLESADMMYQEYETVIGDDYGYDYRIQPFFSSDIDSIPCWSLAALFDILPILDNRSPVISKTFDREYRVLYHSTAYEKAIYTEDYDNLIDACYEMILKLNKLNLL